MVTSSQHGESVFSSAGRLSMPATPTYPFTSTACTRSSSSSINPSTSGGMKESLSSKFSPASLAKQAGKSIKEVGGHITLISKSEQSDSIAQIMAGRNDSPSVRDTDAFDGVRENCDALPTTRRSHSDSPGLEIPSLEHDEETRDQEYVGSVSMTRALTPVSTRRKLVKKALSVPKLGGNHRQLQSLPAEDISPHFSQENSASTTTTAYRSPNSTVSGVAGSSLGVKADEEAKAAKDCPRAIVIEPLPHHGRHFEIPKPLSTSGGNGLAGNGILGRTSKRIDTKFFRSIGWGGKDDQSEAAAAVTGLDKDIGLKLALPDKIDIMCGKATPPPPGTIATNGSSANVDQRDDKDHNNCTNPFAYHTPTNSPKTSKKKIIMLPNDVIDAKTPLSAIRKKLHVAIPNVGGMPNTHLTPPASAGSDASVQSTDSRTSNRSRSSRHSRSNSKDCSSSVSIAKPTDDRPVRATADPIKDEIVIRTSELDPSVHQVTLPTSTDLLLCARVCALIEGYDRLLRHQASKGRRWFDFAELVGAERHELEKAYLRALGHHKESDLKGKKQPKPDNGAANGLASHSVTTAHQSEEISLLSEIEATATGRFGDPKNLPHPSILKSLLDCGDDIKVEGYFVETIGDDDEGLSIPALEHGERTIFPENYGANAATVTAAIFSSQQHRQFIVCYKGTADQQVKPVKSHTRQKGPNREPSVLHPTHAVLVNPTFRDTYFTNALEKKVFDLLDELTSANPFCDVVYCGHSFGGALSMIGAARYAALFPMMTVHCHTFGAPKVGGTTFRHFANSLPNLKVMRVENGADYYPHFPLGEKWSHAGHTIVLNPPQTDITKSAKDKLAKVKSGTNPIGAGSFIGKNRIPVLAYKFDKRVVGDHQPSSMPYVPSNIHNPSSKALDPLARAKKERGKGDHEMNSYLLGIERFTHLGLPWVTDYVGEEGGGIVRGSDFEERYLV